MSAPLYELHDHEGVVVARGPLHRVRGVANTHWSVEPVVEADGRVHIDGFLLGNIVQAEDDQELGDELDAYREDDPHEDA